MNRELRKKFVNPVPDAEMAHHPKAPSNVAFAIASRPISEVCEEAKHDDSIKIIILACYWLAPKSRTAPPTSGSG